VARPARSADQTSLTVPAGLLGYGTNYNWQVRYEDSHSVWSDYSGLTGFSAAPALAAAVQDGALVLSWPTNALSYALEYATDLPTANWLPASPDPVIQGEFNVITNTIDAEQRFYRLHKP
jgi:hypothetical protein